ncbi:hypothetical protein A2U01_0021228, partial [Trifolium medium]|nr:hypothetical protein [Trifolium medium]
MLVWVLWNNTNNCVWNNAKEPGQQLGVKALCRRSDWDAVQVAHNRSAQAEQLHLQQTVQWQKPTCGRYKCNVNA